MSINLTTRSLPFRKVTTTPRSMRLLRPWIDVVLPRGVL
jgi:hypothetical protein